MLRRTATRCRTLAAEVVTLARGRHPEPPSRYGLSDDEADVLMTAIYRRGDRLMGGFLLVHAAVALALASAYDTWFVTTVVSASALGLFFANARLLPASFATRVSAGVALQIFVALHIYQMHGLAEMHFFFFTAFTMMIVYQDWLCMWPGTLLIIAQHILFAALHNAGYQLYFFEVDYVTIMRLVFHFGIALVHVGVCGYWAVLVRLETFTDAGQRKALHLQSDELAEARDQALAATKAKSDFLAAMSHEIRTPMNGVIGVAGLLKQSALGAEQRTYVNVIQESSESLLRIINDLLDFSKIEAGRLDVDVGNFEVRPLVDGAVDVVSSAATRKGLRIDVTVADDVPTTVAADAGRIRQILVNFLSNAVKYTPAGHVSVRLSATRRAAGDLTLRIEVTDTGIGIPQGEQHRLFEQFTRLEGAQKLGAGGTGLGLAICRRLATLMRGDVGVASTEGKGSTFWAEIPVRWTAGADVAPSRDGTATVDFESGTWHVLVADDNPVNQQVSTMILEKLNCRVDTVDNGAEAFAAVLQRHYDLVLMDCQMPVMDGYVATARIRSLPGDRSRVPIVALTAAAVGKERERCLAAGMDDYVAKPVTLEQLARVLRPFLGPHRITRAEGGSAA